MHGLASSEANMYSTIRSHIVAEDNLVEDNHPVRDTEHHNLYLELP